MSLLRQIHLTPSQAKELVHMGFILKLIKYGVKTDVYNVFVIEAH